MNEHVYAGFWIRTGAAIIDTIVLGIILIPVLTLIYGADYWTGDEIIAGFWDVMLNYVLPAIAVIWFWKAKSATPGKMALGLKIVDAQSGLAPSLGQLVGRYFAYFISILPLMLGIIWVAFDRKKQGWHDKLARTVVIKKHSGM